jgi:hypothetical protein
MLGRPSVSSLTLSPLRPDPVHRNGKTMLLKRSRRTTKSLAAPPRRDTPDTGRPAGRSRIHRRHTCAGLALWLLCAGVPGAALAQGAPLSARVVWVDEGRVYLAATDSLALERGSLLTFVWRGKRVAAAEVERVYDARLARATLTSGTLAKVKLERLRILAERPRPRSVPILRVGYPAPGRSNLLFACGSLSVQPPAEAGPYRTEARGDQSFRLVRDGGPSMARWPDTLLVRFYDEAADQEIALERGELDVAVFWPGELSAHMRSQPGWRDHALATRSRGVIAAVSFGSDSTVLVSITRPESLALAALDQEVFRGDLAALPAALQWSAAPSPVAGPPGPPRFEVEASCPGHELIERVLNRGRAPAAGEAPRPLRLFYLDTRLEPHDDFALDAVEHLGLRRWMAEVPRSSQAPPVVLRGTVERGWFLASITPLFALGCPVLSAPHHREYVSALGESAFADMLDCRAASRRP